MTCSFPSSAPSHDAQRVGVCRSEWPSHVGWGSALWASVLVCISACSGAAPLESEHEVSESQQAPMTIAQVTVERDATAETKDAPAETGIETVSLEELQADSEARNDGDTLAENETRSDEDGPADSETAGQPALDDSESDAHALAHFVRLPLDSTDAMVAAGLDEQIPPPFSCIDEFGQTRTALNKLEPLDLLDAGHVSILPAGAGQAVELAPHAFPSVSSFASGVVYTTRDREASALPGGVHYTIVVGGSERIPALELTGFAPEELREVTVGGVPLGQVQSISRSAPIDLTWAVGSPEDIVFVDLVSSVDERPLLRCSYPDDRGSASVPVRELATLNAQPARLTLHRHRSLASSPNTPVGSAAGGYEGVDEARLRFDFELSHTLQLTP